jgi:hypothetical protein
VCSSRNGLRRKLALGSNHLEFLAVTKRRLIEMPERNAQEKW